MMWQSNTSVSLYQRCWFLKTMSGLISFICINYIIKQFVHFSVQDQRPPLKLNQQDACMYIIRETIVWVFMGLLTYPSSYLVNLSIPLHFLFLFIERVKQTRNRISSLKSVYFNSLLLNLPTRPPHLLLR